MKSDTSNTLSDRTPQSSYSKKGESARVPNWSRNSFTLFGNLNLPYLIEARTQFDFSNGVPYNITTGIDSNGDGNLTDRPSYASAPAPGVYSTPYGLMTENSQTATFQPIVVTQPRIPFLTVLEPRGAETLV